MKFEIHKSEDRGYANHGWLKAYHSFSFASWYNPKKLQFGALRVLNDDTVAPKMGFGTHPHENMEIITIPLSGAIKHEDSMGNKGIISAGEIQVMSAGSGVHHSEVNASLTDELKLFQIWIFPNKQNVVPRYDQRKIDLLSTPNEWVQLVSDSENDDGTWIHQKAWIKMGKFEQDKELKLQVKDSKNGIYLLVVNGQITINNEILNNRDAIAISEFENIIFKTNTESELLFLEIPMNY